MKGYVKFAFPAIAAAAPMTASAQDICGALLSGGVFDVGVAADERSMANYMRSRFCRSSSSSSSAGGALELLKVLPTPIAFNFGSESSNEENVCNDTEVDASSWQSYLVWVKEASPVLADAFVRCVSSEGLHVWARSAKSRNSFNLHADLAIKEAGRVTPAKLSFGFVPKENVEYCTPKSIEQLQKVELGNWDYIDTACYLKDPFRGVTIGLSTEGRSPQVDRLEIVPLRVAPIFIVANEAESTNGVEVPPVGGVTRRWSPGGDTLIDRYRGTSRVLPDGGYSSASWVLTDIEPGRYDVYATYANASNDPRPLDLLVNGKVQLAGIMKEATSTVKHDWMTRKQIRQDGDIKLDSETVEITLKSNQVNQSWPHFRALRLVYIGPE